MMRRRMLVMGAAGVLLAGSCATMQDTPAGFTTVTIEKPVHFSAPDGADVMTAPGRYHVDSIEETELRLTPAEATPETSPLIVAAMALPHEEPIESRVALSVPNGEDEHHVVLLMPEGKGLDAGGTYSGTRARGATIAPLPMAQVQAAFVQQGPVVRDHRTPLFSRIEYLGNYPADRGPGWSEELQGVAHDSRNWFFTQKSKLWKFPVTHDLNWQISGSDPSRGILAVGIPELLKRLRYDHFGDLDHAQGFLFIPLEGPEIPAFLSMGRVVRPGVAAPSPRIAIFRAQDLSFVGSFVLTGQTKAGWCALRVETDGLYLYTSNEVIDRTNPIFRYRVDMSRLNANPDNAIQFVNHVGLYQGNTPLDIKPYLQGGEFSPDGSHFFLVNGKDDDFNPRDGGVWVFRGTPLQLVTKSTENKNAGTFFFEFHPDKPKWEEPEGITFWDLDGSQSPNLPGGQLHIILLDNDASSDEFFLKHYRLVKPGSAEVTGPGSNQPPPACASNPILFEHDNYRGRGFYLFADVPDLRLNVIMVGTTPTYPNSFNDKASSLCVPAGRTITLYEHVNYAGQSWQIPGPQNWGDLHRNGPNGQNWGDKVSSVRMR